MIYWISISNLYVLEKQLQGFEVYAYFFLFLENSIEKHISCNGTKVCVCASESSHAKRPACVWIKGHFWQQVGPVPWLHYQQLQRSLIRIPAGQRSRTSSSPAKGAHLSERHGDHRPTNLPRLPDCQALCLHIKDKRTELESKRAEQPFYLEMVRSLNPLSMPFENAY